MVILPRQDKKPIPYYKDMIDDPTGFKARARKHQSDFRQQEMAEFVDLYGTRITDINGHERMWNFHPLASCYVKNRYPGRRPSLYCDLLRSEHIPFNFFAPLFGNQEMFLAVLNDYFGGTIDTIDKYEIEYAPQPKKRYLNDGTAFDTYIDYTNHDGSRGMIGIEVKYTEGDYKIGTKEAREVENTDSLYWQVTRNSNLYREDIYPKLTTDRYRQLWRNHILGQSIMQRHPNKWDYFTLVMLYPEGNTHFGQVTKEYSEFLKDKTDNKFLPITYQSYLDTCEKHATDMRHKGWLNWCKLRYIHD